MRGRKQRAFYVLVIIALFVATGYASSGYLLTAVGRFLVRENTPRPSDAVVVLYTGTQWYPRLMEAAALYREGYARRVVINGNRKTRELRDLEKIGFRRCCSWQEDPLRILAILGVPREAVTAVSAEDAYDTVSEARVVGGQLLKAGIRRIIIATSRYHTRRAGYIWEHAFPGRFIIRMAGARNGPFSPHCWWKDGRQIRWVLAEYGAWIYYFWKWEGPGGN